MRRLPRSGATTPVPRATAIDGGLLEPYFTHFAALSACAGNDGFREGRKYLEHAAGAVPKIAVIGLKADEGHTGIVDTPEEPGLEKRSIKLLHFGAIFGDGGASEQMHVSAVAIVLKYERDCRVPGDLLDFPAVLVREEPEDAIEFARLALNAHGPGVKGTGLHGNHHGVTEVFEEITHLLKGFVTREVLRFVVGFFV